MALCKYCHKEMTKDNLHEECEREHEKGINELEKLFLDFLSGPYTTYDDIEKQRILITLKGYLSDADEKSCTLHALKQFTESIGWPYCHTYEKNAKRLVEALQHEPAFLYDNTALNNALQKLAEKLVKGYYDSYFSIGASEFEVLKNIHKVTLVLPLDADKEKEICKEVFDEANERKEGRALDYAHHFIDDEGGNPFTIPTEILGNLNV